MRRTFVVLASLFAMAGVARAADAGDPGQACSGSTSEMSNCLKTQAAQWDWRLNTAYQNALKAAPPNQAEQLRAAQRLWIQYREANCLYYSLNAGAGAGAEACMRDMTQRRAKELEASSEPKTPVTPGYPEAAGSWGGIVRAGPGENYARVGDLKEDDKVVLLERSDVVRDGYPWFRIQFSGQGFMWGGILCAVGQPSPDIYKTCP